jgi:hypothetical protein
MKTTPCHVGTLKGENYGLPWERVVWFGSPGDWPAVKAELANPEAWSTVRLGIFLLAVGPAQGELYQAIDRTLAAPHFYPLSLQPSLN